MKNPEGVTKTEGNDASSPWHMAEQPLFPCYKRRTVTSEGCAALSFLWLSPWQQRDYPGSSHPHHHPPLMTGLGATYRREPDFTWGRQIE